MGKTSMIAKRIRVIREQRQMTIEELAANIPGDKAVNQAVINALEAGKQVPSLTPLLQIARALGVRLGSFLDDQTKQEPVVTKADGMAKTVRFTGSNLGGNSQELNFHSLAANKNDRHMEPFIVEVNPRNGGNITLSTHEGEEFIYVLSGNIEVAYGKTSYQLSAGDSIYYDSVVPHHLHACGAEQARILAVIYAPF